MARVSSAPDVASFCMPFVRALAVDGASISVFGHDGVQATICSSDAIAARAEELQFELGEGPHWEALARRHPVLCPNLADERESDWPVFLESARGIGIGALFAIPMVLGAALVGIVDLYCLRPHHLDERSTSLASALAGRIAASAVDHAMFAATNHESEETSISPALRREVHQATGMILSQLEISATDAFSRLQGYAFSSGRTIEDIAHEVVGRRLAFDNLPD